MAQVRNVRPGHAVINPNRDKALCKLTKLIIFGLIAATVVLMMVLTIGGWTKLQGMKPVNFAWSAIFVALSVFVLRWARGLLPIAAALAMLLLIVAVIAAFGLDGTSWYQRSHTGFAGAGSLFGGGGLSNGVLGTVTVLLIPVEIALIIVAMIGFAQGWNVEVEVPEEEARRRGSKPVAVGPKEDKTDRTGPTPAAA